jgi:hypothetical protein
MNMRYCHRQLKQATSAAARIGNGHSWGMVLSFEIIECIGGVTSTPIIPMIIMTISRSRRLKPLFSQVANTNQTRQLNAQFLQSCVRSTIIGEENSNGCKILPALSATAYRPRRSDVALIEITDNIAIVIERV